MKLIHEAVKSFSLIITFLSTACSQYGVENNSASSMDSKATDLELLGWPFEEHRAYKSHEIFNFTVLGKTHFIGQFLTCDEIPIYKEEPKMRFIGSLYINAEGANEDGNSSLNMEFQGVQGLSNLDIVEVSVAFFDVQQFVAESLSNGGLGSINYTYFTNLNVATGSGEKLRVVEPIYCNTKFR